MDPKPVESKMPVSEKSRIKFLTPDRTCSCAAALKSAAFLKSSALPTLITTLSCVMGSIEKFIVVACMAFCLLVVHGTVEFVIGYLCLN